MNGVQGVLPLPRGLGARSPHVSRTGFPLWEPRPAYMRALPQSSVVASLPPPPFPPRHPGKRLAGEWQEMGAGESHPMVGNCATKGSISEARPAGAPRKCCFSGALPPTPSGAYPRTPFLLTFPPPPAILRPRMENQTTNIDLSALDTEAMRSRLSELGSYL